MGELVTVKAEALKWCPFGFGFTHPWNYRKYRLHEVREDKSLFCRSIETEVLRFEEVQVDPREYEKAVIDNIEEMLDHKILRISKKTLPFDKSPTIWVTYRVKKTMASCNVDVKADPRPWEDEYLIWI